MTIQEALGFPEYTVHFDKDPVISHLENSSSSTLSPTLGPISVFSAQIFSSSLSHASSPSITEANITEAKTDALSQSLLTSSEEKELKEKWGKTRAYADLLSYIYVLVENQQSEKALTVLEEPSHLKNLGYLKSVVLLSLNRFKEAKKAIINHLHQHPHDLEAWIWLTHKVHQLDMKNTLPLPPNEHTKLLIVLKIFDNQRLTQHDVDCIFEGIDQEKNIWVLFAYLLSFSKCRSESDAYEKEEQKVAAKIIDQLKCCTPFLQKLIIYYKSTYESPLLQQFAQDIFKKLYQENPTSTTTQLCFAACLLQKSHFSLDPLEQQVVTCLNQKKDTSEPHRLIAHAYEAISQMPHDLGFTLQMFAALVASDISDYKIWSYVINNLALNPLFTDLFLFALKKVNKIYPNNLWGHFFLALHYKESSQTALAVQELKKVTFNELMPYGQRGKLLPTGGCLLYNDGEYRRAFEFFKQATISTELREMRMQRLIFSCSALCNGEYTEAIQNALLILHSFKSQETPQKDQESNPFLTGENQNFQADAWCCYFIAIALQKEITQDASKLIGWLEKAEQFKKNQHNLIFQMAKLLVLHRLKKMNRVRQLLDTKSMKESSDPQECSLYEHPQQKDGAFYDFKPLHLFDWIKTKEEYEALEPVSREIYKKFLFMKTAYTQTPEENLHTRHALMTIIPNDLAIQALVIRSLHDLKRSDEAIALLQTIPEKQWTPEHLGLALTIFFDPYNKEKLCQIGMRCGHIKPNNNHDLARLLVAQAEYACGQKKTKQAIDLLTKAKTLSPLEESVQKRIQEFQESLSTKLLGQKPELSQAPLASQPKLFTQQPLPTSGFPPGFPPGFLPEPCEKQKGPPKLAPGLSKKEQETEEIRRKIEQARLEKKQKSKKAPKSQRPHNPLQIKSPSPPANMTFANMTPASEFLTTATQLALVSSSSQKPLVQIINNGGTLSLPLYRFYNIITKRAHDDELGLITSSLLHLCWLIDSNNRPHIEGTKLHALLYYAFRLFETLKRLPGFEQLSQFRNHLRHSKCMTLQKMEELVINLESSDLQKCLKQMRRQASTCTLKLCTFSEDQLESEDEFNIFFILQLEVAKKVCHFVEKLNTGKSALEHNGDLKASLMGSCLLLSEAISKYRTIFKKDPFNSGDTEKILLIGNTIAHEIGKDVGMLRLAARDEVFSDELFWFMQKSKTIKADPQTNSLIPEIAALSLGP